MGSSFLAMLIERVEPLGLEMFAKHYSCIPLSDGDYTTEFSFDDLGERATLSRIRTIINALSLLEVDTGIGIPVHPIKDISVDFVKGIVTMKSNSSVLRKLNLNRNILVKLSFISEFLIGLSLT